MLESANLMILFNSVESTELAEHEQYSGSPERVHYLGSNDGANLRHEKGCTVEAALEDDWFFNHEENQHYPVLDCGRIAKIHADNQPSLRGAVGRLQVTESHSQDRPDMSGAVHHMGLYGIFVGHIAINSFSTGWLLLIDRCIHPSITIQPLL